MIQTTFKFATCDDTFAGGCLRLAHELKEMPGLLKVSIFLGAESESEWNEKKQCVLSYLNEAWEHNGPVVSFIAQKPFNNDLAAECISCTSATAEIIHKQLAGEHYIVLKDKDLKLVWANGGNVGPDQTTGQQSTRLMNRVEQILDQEGMSWSHIIRQWNYLPAITGFYSGIQNYQAFNDARSLFYNQAKWENGYPAATGIGTSYGEVGIEVIAAASMEDVHPIRNQQQIDAHSYSEEMLEGKNTAILNQKSTPKFERAKLIDIEDSKCLFVSGTAAIKGEHNCYQNDPEQQTTLTLNHIDELINTATEVGQSSEGKWNYQSMRVYIKREEDYPAIKAICEQRYPETAFVYVYADVCRDELLVEIEAFVTA
jgi:enamine deaminase RidA (YjgF/YER057c/UK114 family)